MSEQLAPLTALERTDLQYHEQRIEKGRRAMFESGESLKYVRDNRLYREQYGTFEEYCDKRWSISKRHAYELISAKEVIESLPENVRHGAQNERQVRELKKVEPAKRAEVLQKAIEASGGKLTAKAIAEAAKPEATVAPDAPKVSETAQAVSGGVTPARGQGSNVPPRGVSAADKWSPAAEHLFFLKTSFHMACPAIRKAFLAWIGETQGDARPVRVEINTHQGVNDETEN